MEIKFGAKFENTGFWKILKSLIEWLMIICSVGCSGVIIISTIMRYFFTKNWYGSDEIILMFAFWLYFMGAAYGSYENSHIKADIVASLAKNIRRKDILSLLAQVVLVVVNFVTANEKRNRYQIIERLFDTYFRLVRNTLQR